MQTPLVRQDVMYSTPTVLVYDDAIETSEVLAAVYQPRGFEVRRLSSQCKSAEHSDYGGAVVVLSSREGEPSRQPKSTRKVLIGRVVDQASGCEERGVAACRLSSLFDYRELVSAIDRLLCETD
jgi:predicted SPOUT superfamily RNA methylase MTH1